MPVAIVNWPRKARFYDDNVLIPDVVPKTDLDLDIDQFRHVDEHVQCIKLIHHKSVINNINNEYNNNNNNNDNNNNNNNDNNNNNNKDLFGRKRSRRP